MNSDSPASSVLELIARDLERGTRDLPMLQRTAADALRLAAAPDLDFRDVVLLAESDPSLAARLLGVANSVVYGAAAPASSLRAAAARLGLQALRDLLYMAVYSTTLLDGPRYREVAEAVFKHSVLVGRIAQRYAVRSGTNASVAFAAGLLHDVGRARCLKIAARRCTSQVAPSEVIAATDVLHEQAGAALAIAWNLPEEVVEACRSHHAPGPAPLARLIAMANEAARCIEATPRSTEADVARFAEPLGFGVEEVLEAARECADATAGQRAA